MLLSFSYVHVQSLGPYGYNKNLSLFPPPSPLCVCVCVCVCVSKEVLRVAVGPTQAFQSKKNFSCSGPCF